MKDLYLTDGQYHKILDNLSLEIENGLKLSGFDDNTPGDKDTQCTWGLCGENPNVHRDANMHLFPEQLPGRQSSKYRKDHHRCPFEDPNSKSQSGGCFYRCRFFIGGQKPSKEVWKQWKKEALTWSAKKSDFISKL